MAGSGIPASFSTRASSSTNGTRRRLASARPMVLLPAPRSPTSATMRRSVRSCWAEKSSSPAEVPNARATSCSRATEMFPSPASSSARNRSDTPLFCARSRRVNDLSSRRRRTAAPTEASRTWCSGRIVMQYTAHELCATSNIVLASAQSFRYLPSSMDTSAPAPKLQFDTHPSKYRHWTLAVDGEVARLTMKVAPFGGANSEVELKSNSYDLSVDIELADAIQRLRFEHPSVRSCVITSAHDKIFCAGANIYMLAASTHPFKVNFWKCTNETRLAIEDASQFSGIRFLAACNGATAGGGYELALACDEIVLSDDGSSTVSLPEVPLLGVLPGTGGLTRVVDKRKVRRDLADAFSTLAEGVKGKRAVDWGLVDAVIPRSKFAAGIAERAKALARSAPPLDRGPGMELGPLEPRLSDRAIEYRYVKVDLDPKARTADLTVRAPDSVPKDAAEAHAQGAEAWGNPAARELDDALLRLRFEHEQIGIVLLRTEGDRDKAYAAGEAMMGPSFLFRETRLLWGRVLRRLDVTARSFFAVVDEKSCFAGPLFELLAAA